MTTAALDSILTSLGNLAHNLRQITMSHGRCLSWAQEHDLLRIRLDLQSAAGLGGSVDCYKDGPESDIPPRTETTGDAPA